MSQEEILSLIHQNAGIEPQEIVEKTGLHKTTVYCQISALRKKRLVIQKPFSYTSKLYPVEAP